MTLRPSINPPVRRVIEALSRPRKTPTPEEIARRRRWLAVAKKLLPSTAIVILLLIGLWPQLDRTTERARLSLNHVGVPGAETMRMIDAHYHGVDTAQRPFTLTASVTTQPDTNQVRMTGPIADLTLADGQWLASWADHGLYHSHEQQLDLSGNVVLYRDDGTFIYTDNAAIDLQNGAGASPDRTHIEGPFGTLDAQGFTVLDHGNEIQFTGPVKLVLNNDKKGGGVK